MLGRAASHGCAVTSPPLLIPVSSSTAWHKRTGYLSSVPIRVFWRAEITGAYLYLTPAVGRLIMLLAGALGEGPLKRRWVGFLDINTPKRVLFRQPLHG